MTTADLTALLDRLRAEPRESEWLELKATRLDAQSLGEYGQDSGRLACAALALAPAGRVVTARPREAGAAHGEFDSGRGGSGATGSLW